MMTSVTVMVHNYNCIQIIAKNIHFIINLVSLINAYILSSVGIRQLFLLYSVQWNPLFGTLWCERRLSKLIVGMFSFQADVLKVHYWKIFSLDPLLYWFQWPACVSTLEGCLLG